MRGTLHVVAITQDRRGIIPAYAGNTLGKRRDETKRQDHPRVCGEHCRGVLHGRPSKGSSPRMRGTPTCRASVSLSGGIIPAYAGNTRTVRRIRLQAGDHPRVCGEHKNPRVNCRDFTGSSPRMRGTLRHHCGQFVNDGIIPAYAGNTADHDRFGQHEVGSSPRMRGTLVIRTGLELLRGIIPAYAGNTLRD